MMTRFAALLLAGSLIIGPLPLAARTTKNPAPISEADLRNHISILASDAYEGRAPGTKGETKTVTYIAQALADAGLQPGASATSWYQPVTLLTIKPKEATFSVAGPGKSVSLSGNDVMIRGRDRAITLSDLPAFFAGYGVDESGKPLGDVKGKLVFLLMEEPASGTVKDYRDRREAVAKAGAAAIFGIVPDKSSWAGYQRSFGESTTIASRQSAAPVDGVIRRDAVKALFEGKGAGWERSFASAGRPDFTGTLLERRVTLAVTTDISPTVSHNVIGRIAGKNGASKGTVLFLSHWDHLGVCRPEGTPDRICNGAVDNASGIAVLIETAKRLAQGPRPDRDIYFLATTAEEKGLLGAYAFADQPVVPLDTIVAAFNMDTIALAPKGARSAILGRGTTPLDGAIDTIAASLGRTIETGTESNVMIQRQDGWALKARGVPTVMVGGSFADMKMLMAYLEKDYHGPEDEVKDSLELGGAAQDATLHVALGRYFSSVEQWPAAPKR